MPPFASASLYVGDLAQDVDERVLFELFNPSVSVASIRVCRDAITRRSLGYAYVNFHNPEDADRVLQTYNHMTVKNRPIRVMWSQRDPTQRRSGENNVFIKHLDTSIDNKLLYDTFSEFGQILSCKVVTDDKNQSLGYGFVHFADKDAAAAAIEKVNGNLIANKKVYVAPFMKREERQKQIGDHPAFQNLYVRGFPASWEDSDLKKHFGKFGEIRSSVIKTSDEHNSRFAFVCYTSAEHASAALAELNEKEFDGSKLYVNRFQRKAERLAELRRKHENKRAEFNQQSTNLYIKHLGPNVDDERLRKEFSKFGTITSAKVVTSATNGASRGFGFVCFSSPDEAMKAVQEMHQNLLDGKPLYVALAQSKEVRRAHLEALYTQQKRAFFSAGPQIPGQAPMYPHGQPLFAYPPPNMNMGMGMGMGMGMMPRYPYYGVRPGANMMRPANPAQQGGNRMYPAQPAVPGMSMRNPSRPNQNRAAGPRAGVAPNAVPATQAPKAAAAPAGQNATRRPAAKADAPATNNVLAKELAGMSDTDQKQALGERLYPLVLGIIGEERAPKITGMLLDLETSDLLGLLEQQNELKLKVQEAVAVLEAAESSSFSESA